MASLGAQQAGGFSGGVLKLNIVRLPVVAILGGVSGKACRRSALRGEAGWDRWGDPCSPPGPGSRFSAAKQPVVHPLSPPGASTQFLDRHFPGTTCVLLILMS